MATKTSKQEEATVAHEDAAPDVRNGGPIEVRATRVGYYGNRRHYPAGFDHPRAGEVFFLKAQQGKRKGKVMNISAEAQFSAKWMERVSPEEAAQDMRFRQAHPAKKAVITKTAADRSVI